MTQPTYRFKRLLDRTWGAYGTGHAPIPGQEVDIMRRDGRHVTAIVASIIWTGDNAWIARLRDAKKIAQPEPTQQINQNHWAGYTPEMEEE